VYFLDRGRVRILRHLYSYATGSSQLVLNLTWKLKKTRISILFSCLVVRRLFGGLIQDIKLKAKWYVSDYKDGLHVQCIAAFFFMYFACLTPIVTFGGLLGAATDNYIVRFSASLLVSKVVTTNLFWGCYLGGYLFEPWAHLRNFV